MTSDLPTVVDFKNKFELIRDQWSPKIVAEMNDHHFKLARIEGEFVWHRHKEADETFIVLDGEMSIEFRAGKIEMKAGEMCVVPKGLEHKPYAAKECRILLIEPAGTRNTGDAGGDMTAEDDAWI